MAITYDFPVKTLSDIRSSIFSDDQHHSEAKYEDANKKALLEELLQKRRYKSSNRDLLITRFYPKQLPINYTIEQHTNKSKTFVFLPTIFDYKPTDDIDVVEWHMNFANNDIFAFYNSNLLAQDELQVLECPQLASLREYFNLQQNEKKVLGKKIFNTTVIEEDLPYPILISNVERVICLNTTNLYGNNFSLSPRSTVLKSYDYLKTPQIINIIAIEAPKYGQGKYTEKQIQYILHECFTAYSAAKTLANITYSLNRGSSGTPTKTYIHTGWFGCGAYGGNRTIMIVLQILAAKMAGIDKLIFHTVTLDYQDDIKAAEDCLNHLFEVNQSSLSLDDVVEKIFNEKFQWGQSNGT